MKEVEVSELFNKRPVNPARHIQVHMIRGYEELLREVVKPFDRAGGQRTLIVDGTHGADFDGFVGALAAYLSDRSIKFTIYPTTKYMKSGAQLQQWFAGDISDNRSFGKMTTGSIGDYFEPEARETLRSELRRRSPQEEERRNRWTVILGPGAAWLSGDSDFRLFLDITRENQQILHQKGLQNFGFNDNMDTLEKYKIAFFVEWPILETYRKRVVGKFDFYVDMNAEQTPVAVTADDLSGLIRAVAAGPMRVKPFFAPGVWGGQYLKKLADLPDDWVNCAWSFEPIAPENSILIGCEGGEIEVPFTLVMNVAYRDILGERVSGLFGDYFPIRFDYLDTIGGTNLSVQVHPKQAYIRERFNYILEQQESYYIMEKKQGSKVYLGLTETAAEDSFLPAVEAAQATGTPIEFTDYVQEWDCEKGDLFLIPTGTVHCSGSDNLVLEISATTWWFTFKIYDYVRKGLDGNPRPINIDHAAANIDWYKKRDWVERELIARPVETGRQGESVEYELGSREDLLFYVNRLHLTSVWEDDTRGEVLLLNLVEGQRVRIEPLAVPEAAVEFAYAESYILPAAVGAFRIHNLGDVPAKLIKAGVSPQWNQAVIDG